MGLEIKEELDSNGKFADWVTMFGDCTLDELQEVIDHYRKLGFNKVWHGNENSTLCIQRMKDET